jgi:hypothetical protein
VDCRWNRLPNRRIPWPDLYKSLADEYATGHRRETRQQTTSIPDRRRVAGLASRQTGDAA